MQVQKTLLRAANSLFNLVVFLLLVAALLLFLHNEAEDRQAGESARTAVDKLHLLMGENTPGAPDPTAGMEPGPTEPTEETVPPPTELTVVSIDGNDYIGYLSIPEFELELPVMADWSMEKLQLAPCLQYGSPLTDDAVIAGHNFKQHFRALHDIQVGEHLSFTDMSGYTIEYQVVEVETINPTNVYEVINSQYDLILYTCTIGGVSRVTVRCNRVEHITEPLEDPTP